MTIDTWHVKICDYACASCEAELGVLWHLTCERREVEDSMAKDDVDRTKHDESDRTENKVFGDMDPAPGTSDRLPGAAGAGEEEDVRSMSGGSQNDPDELAGNRDVTGGIGGVGPETGGTRNLRQGSGATGGDIGNRPEVYKPR